MDDGCRLPSRLRHLIHFVRKDFTYRSIKSEGFRGRSGLRLSSLADGCASGSVSPREQSNHKVCNDSAPV